MIIRTETLIKASPAKVWKVLLDFENYPNWNPFIKSLSGNPQVGSRLKVFIHPPGGQKMKFTPLVDTMEVEKKFSWKGKLLIPGIFDGHHAFEIQKITEDEVKFVHSETFSGILVALLSSTLSKTKAGFEMMNVALKKRAEG